MSASAARPSRRPRVDPARVALRAAAAEDCERTWTWRNDPVTRAVSLDSAEIPWEVHRRWFAESLRRADRKLYVIVVQDRPAGVARLDIAGSDATVSIHLAPECRGKGVGPIALRKLAAIARRGRARLRLVAHVRADNRPSLSAFGKAGFAETARDGGVVTLERRWR